MTNYDFIEEGARVGIKTEKQLWETYPSRRMPCSLAPDIVNLLGTSQIIDCVDIVTRETHNMPVSTYSWRWSEGALLSATTPKGNSF